jgi:2-dehydro-3-deoxyphosphogluconate aldolase/(4S)-4-hydroxy-2-oxoglutarate aldolase
MTARDVTRGRIAAAAAIAVIRLDAEADAQALGEALLEGGVTVLEVTLTSPGALELIRALAELFPDDALVGVGSVLSAEAARSAIEAGASFVVSPVLDEGVIAAAHNADVPAFAGAFSPTELQRAHQLGADFIKVFPADVVGMSYFKSVLAPLPHLRLVPTGGVTLDNAGDWLRAGAAAVGVGSALVDKTAIAERRFGVLTDNARRLMRSIDAFRQG